MLGEWSASEESWSHSPQCSDESQSLDSDWLMLELLLDSDWLMMKLLLGSDWLMMKLVLHSDWLMLVLHSDWSAALVCVCTHMVMVGEVCPEAG